MQVATPQGLGTVHPSIKKLVDMLVSEDADTVVKALKTAYNLCKAPRNREHFMNSGVVCKLTELCGHPNNNIKENSAKVLLSLAEGEDNINIIAEIGGIGAMVGLLPLTHAETVVNALKTLTKLCEPSLINRELFRDMGGLAHLLDCLKRDNEWIQLNATRALMASFSDDPFSLETGLQQLNLVQVFSHYKNHLQANPQSGMQ